MKIPQADDARNTARRGARAAQAHGRSLGTALRRDAMVNGLASSPFCPNALRLRLLRAYGMSVGRCWIDPGSWFGGSQITFGDGVYINRECWFDNSAAITIGNNCAFGPRVLILTSHHEPGTSGQRLSSLEARPVEVGAGTWIGAGVVVLPGVKIAAGCLIAAGAVVTRDCAPDGLYAGTPARRLRDL